MTANGISIEIDGLTDVMKAVRKIEDGADDLKQVHGDAARKIEQSVVNVPFVSGRLAASVRSTGQVGAGVIRAGKKAVPYAGPIHWGWPARGIKANPFLVTAAERKTPAVVGIYSDGMQALIKKHKLD